ncbi:ABC-ATPase domain-containing protein [Auritidibacter ignavus]|uniref:ABC-ATPase domain-containing protein n=1 Tax=Auritidibacter ignavus TaxID=678932 RepID=UPI00109C2C14|nr:ABC-ATPase domain-containing protein [Auritidibacter ignavus]
MSLAKQLHALDGQSYAKYRNLKGEHQLGELTVHLDHIQADPYAPPSTVRVVATADHLENLADHLTTVATTDYLARRIHQRAPREISIGTFGPEVLERSCIQFHRVPGSSRWVMEIHLLVSLPAAGRRIKGHQAARLITQVLPDLLRDATKEIDHQELDETITLLKDQQAIRDELPRRGLVAFIANGSVLPRAAGHSSAPLHYAEPFESPDSVSVSFDLPSGRTLTGMGIAHGITLIVGGGYHGKSTVLNALEHGVYPHRAGDGREFVITDPDAVAIRAEDGRSVAGVDISSFISDLPQGTDTTRFSTTNASGSTSQATNVVEALEAGASAVLIDEDTSATNFMVRDELMRQLVKTEPITPFTARIKELADQGISTVLVAGGTGAFFSVADRVLGLENYCVSDLTAEAHRLGAQQRHHCAAQPLRLPKDRVPQQIKSPRKPPRARGVHTIQIGHEDIDLSALSQLVSVEQTRAIAGILEQIIVTQQQGDNHNRGEKNLTLRTLSELAPRWKGHLAMPRRHEVMAAVNRLRSLKVS